MKKKVIRLTESDIENLVKKIIKEDNELEWISDIAPMDELVKILEEKFRTSIEVDLYNDNVIKIYFNSGGLDSPDGMESGLVVALGEDFYRLGEFYESMDYDENGDSFSLRSDDWYWFDEQYDSVEEILEAIEREL